MPILLAVMMVALLSVQASAAQLLATLEHPTTNEDGTPITDLAGCLLYYGEAPASYHTTVDMRMDTSVIVGGLAPETRYHFSASCHDTSGNQSDLTPEVSQITLADPAPDTTPPLVEIVSPLDGNMVARKSRVDIQVLASDDRGPVTVEIYVNDVWLCARGLAPYQCIWKVPNAKNRLFHLRARATDKAGNMSEAMVSVSTP